MKDKRILIYLEKDKLSPRGGPYGVGYYLFKEIQDRGIGGIAFLDSSSVEKSEKTFVGDVMKFIRLFIAPSRKNADAFNQYDAIHFHTARDLFVCRKALEKYSGKVVLTSHCPEPPALETMHRISDRVPRAFRSILSAWLEKADRFSFSRADYVVFPCVQAEEPYRKHWAFFNELKAAHPEKFKYVLTGISPCVPGRDTRVVREELEISSDQFVVSFVGRHNEVKGYPELKKLGEQLLPKHDGLSFVIAGKQESIPPLPDERWVEIGYTTDAYSYINSADLFVLPNKETYFDLVLLEVLSLGKPVVASFTGGNKYFEDKAIDGIFLYRSIEEAQTIIEGLMGLSKDELERLGDSNRAFFDEYLTSGCMIESYLSLLESVVGE